MRPAALVATLLALATAASAQTYRCPLGDDYNPESSLCQNAPSKLPRLPYSSLIALKLCRVQVIRRTVVKSVFNANPGRNTRRRAQRANVAITLDIDSQAQTQSALAQVNVQTSLALMLPSRDATLASASWFNASNLTSPSTAPALSMKTFRRRQRLTASTSPRSTLTGSASMCKVCPPRAAVSAPL